ncbi:MAG TPA: PAS domain S-box protein [Candidatus Acidoferrales bacterium]|nr:PAS domain S-box protein [Candidatus Acidoferrales bacterium]
MQWHKSSGPPNEQDPLQDGAYAKFRRIERREWWLWASAVVVTLLLTAGLSSFIFAGFWSSDDNLARFSLPQAVRGLVGLVLIFDIYTIYQQLQIHRIRRQLVEQQELFRLVSENAADMLAVVDMEGRRLYNSLAYWKILGYTSEELKGSSVLEQVHPDDRARVRAAADEARRTGIGASLEYRMHHKDGSWRVLESTSSVIHDSKGQPEKLVIVNRDITERKRASEALRLSEASFRSVVENAPYGIVRAGPSGQLLRVNPALQKMLGYESQEELLRMNLATDLYSDPQQHQHILDLLASQESFRDVEVEWKRKDGTLAKARCSGRLVKNQGEEGDYFEVFAEDITEQRLLERQLRVAQKMEAIGRLSGGIAHDFNNLLGVIIGYSQVLKHKLGAGNGLFEHAEEIEKAGQSAASLTRQLLAFSRQQVLAPAVMNLNSLLSDMGKMLPRLIGEDIELALRLDPGLGRVKADQSQVEQVLMNLAVNARDALPQGGKLTIETANVTLDDAYTRYHPGSRAGDYVMLSVTDTGTGMTADTLAHLFEPFFTTKARGKGTGLGLATVYGVVKQSGGYVWVDSELGKGSSFKVYLPRIEEAVAAAKAPAPPIEALHGAETLLLVEDADALRKLAKALLEEHGYHVVPAANGAEALQIVEQRQVPIDLLLTDVVMPGMNGRALAERLGQLQTGLKVLYMSGYTDSSIVDHGVPDAGTHLLHKPFTEETLVQKVREVLDGGKGRPSAAKEAPVLAGTKPADRR